MIATVSTTVRCDNCHATYETPVTIDVVERIRRCEHCGQPALRIVADSKSDGGQAQRADDSGAPTSEQPA